MKKTIRPVTVTIRRSGATEGSASFEQPYRVPCDEHTTVLEALDYIYEQLDPSLASYDHAACGQGICGHCTALVNGKAALLCQTPLTGDVVVEPPPRFCVVRDLVYGLPAARRWDAADARCDPDAEVLG